MPVKAPVKRARQFEVRKVPWKSLELALFLLSEVNGQAAAALSNEKLFRDFMVLNDVPTGTVPRDFLLLLYAIDITLQGMAATSVRTMMRNILGIFGRAQDPIVGPLVGDTFKILNLIIADEEVDHAKDMTFEVAMEVIGRLSGMAQVIAWFMLVCGARVADLERMFRRQFLFQLNVDGSLTVKIIFNYTKGRRDAKKAYTLVIKLPMEILIPVAVVEAMKVPQGAKVFTMGCDAFNAAIKALGVEFEDYTSYSFRRLFVHRVIERFTGEDEMTAWAEVVKLTAHVQIETVRTSYAKKFGGVL